MNTAPLSSEPAPNHRVAFEGLQTLSISRNRKGAAQAQVQPVYEFGPYLLDAAARLLLRSGKKVMIPPKAFDVLVALIENRGRALGKDELMQIIWPDTFVEQANLAVTISLVRKALGERPGGGQYIETLPRRGYRFAALVREVSEVSSDIRFDEPFAYAGAGRKNADAVVAAWSLIDELQSCNDTVRNCIIVDQSRNNADQSFTVEVQNLIVEVQRLIIKAQSFIVEAQSRIVES